MLSSTQDAGRGHMRTGSTTSTMSSHQALIQTQITGTIQNLSWSPIKWEIMKIRGVWLTKLMNDYGNKSVWFERASERHFHYFQVQITNIWIFMYNVLIYKQLLICEYNNIGDGYQFEFIWLDWWIIITTLNSNLFISHW